MIAAATVRLGYTQLWCGVEAVRFIDSTGVGTLVRCRHLADELAIPFSAIRARGQTRLTGMPT
jgi:hypothetical protein